LIAAGDGDDVDDDTSGLVDSETDIVAAVAAGVVVDVAFAAFAFAFAVAAEVVAVVAVGVEDDARPPRCCYCRE